MSLKPYTWKCEHNKNNADKWNRCSICRQIEYRKVHTKIVPQTNRDRWMRAKFGITEAKYYEMFTKQNGVCAICRQPETEKRLDKIRSLSIDHDHKTGKVRGLLCMHCNAGLGNFRDSSEALIIAAQYLKEHFIA